MIKRSAGASQRAVAWPAGQRPGFIAGWRETKGCHAHSATVLNASRRPHFVALFSNVAMGALVGEEAGRPPSEPLFVGDPAAIVFFKRNES